MVSEALDVARANRHAHGCRLHHGRTASAHRAAHRAGCCGGRIAFGGREASCFSLRRASRIGRAVSERSRRRRAGRGPHEPQGRVP